MFQAYVCGERKGLIEETLKKTNSKLDYKVEGKLVIQKLNELRAKEASKEAIIVTMKDFGMKRFLYIVIKHIFLSEI